jgi:hypothetical protein
MTDARWDDDDQRKIQTKIRSSSMLDKKHLPSHHLPLVFLLFALKTLVSLTQPDIDLLACPSGVLETTMCPTQLNIDLLVYSLGVLETPVFPNLQMY